MRILRRFLVALERWRRSTGSSWEKIFKQHVDWHCSHGPQFPFPALDSSKVRKLHRSRVGVAPLFLPRTRCGGFLSGYYLRWSCVTWWGVKGVDFQSFLLNVQTSGALQGTDFQSLAFSIFSFNGVQMCDGKERNSWNWNWSLRGKGGSLGCIRNTIMWDIVGSSQESSAYGSKRCYTMAMIPRPILVIGIRSHFQ